MLRLLFMVILVIGASFIYGYFQELNPGTMTLHLSPDTSLELSPSYLVLISIATGALMVALLVGLRETKTLIVNWRNNRLRRREEKVATLHREGAHAFLSRRTGEAIQLFEKALALDPHRLESLLWLGNIHRAQQNFTEAIRLHRKAHGLENRNIEVLLELAKDLEGTTRYEEALQTLEDILKLDPSNLTALLGQRDLLIRLEKWSDALDIQHRLVKTKMADEDRSAETRMLVGITYEVGHQLLERGHADKASRYFRSAIKRDTQFLPAYIGLSEILIHGGKGAQAGKILLKAYRKNNNLIFLHRLEELYLDMGEPGEIIRIYQEAIQLNPQDPALQFYLGKLFYRLEMVDDAFRILSALEGPQEQLEDFHKIMADLYLRKQQMDLAVEELQKALAYKKPVMVPYQCSTCRAYFREWSGRCRSCNQWNTYRALPWVNTSGSSSGSQDPSITVRSIPYQGIASPFETV